MTGKIDALPMEAELGRVAEYRHPFHQRHLVGHPRAVGEHHQQRHQNEPNQYDLNCQFRCLPWSYPMITRSVGANGAWQYVAAMFGAAGTKTSRRSGPRNFRCVSAGALDMAEPLDRLWNAGRTG